MTDRSQFEAIVFDLDGTLLDTIEDIADSVNAALSSMGYPTHSTESYKMMVGEGVRHLAVLALPESVRDDDRVIDECMKRTGSEYSKLWNVNTRPYDGIPELLDGLTERGIRMAILSNKPQEFTILNVQEMLRRWKFDAVVGARVGVPVKPDPTTAIEIADELGIEPRKFIYVGDSGVDMKTAIAAGMYPVGVLWGFRDEAELRRDGARSVMNSPVEILELIASAKPLKVTHL